MVGKQFDKQGLVRGMSFNTETGEKESSQAMWEASSYEKQRRSRGNTMDRANSFVGMGSRGRSGSIDERGIASKQVSEAFAIVDPFSTGAHLAAEVCKLGYKCVRVLSIWDSPGTLHFSSFRSFFFPFKQISLVHSGLLFLLLFSLYLSLSLVLIIIVAAMVQEGITVDYIATVQHNDQLQSQEEALQATTRALSELPFTILGVLPGAETGVELADQLAERLGLRTNGTEGSFARRNKYDMGEKVRAAGIRAVKQANCSTLEDMHKFRDQLRIDLRVPLDVPLKVVVKPAQSAGTDDVFLCADAEEAETAFNRILGKINGLGLLNTHVLVQEFLTGIEYVVDKVSRDGLHKLVCIWEYDKRVINDANFVYFGMKLCPSDTKKARILVEYADRVLDALDITQGPSHMEVKLRSYIDEHGEEQFDPCLVEVGARCHGGEGTWIPVAIECIGYTVVNVTLDAWLDGKFFDSLPKDGYELKGIGYDVDMCCRHNGIVRGFPGEAALKAMPSFRSVSWECKPGDYIVKTIDCFTRPGCVQIVNSDIAQCEKDFEFIHSIEEMGLIDFSIISPNPPSVGAVVVVDPFSSGANMAALVLKWGYKLILVFSQKEGSVHNLVAKGSHVKPTLLIQHDHQHPNQDFALEQTINALKGEDTPILAILPGSETGIDLAALLAYQYGTRNNGASVLESLGSRFELHSRLRSVGLHSVNQKLCRNGSEVIDFCMNELGGKSCVVKPNRTDGTSNSWVCSTASECSAAFKYCVDNCFDRHGDRVTEVLCQETVVGRELLLDTVSRDGVHKIVAVWEADTRRTTGGDKHLTHSIVLREASEPDVRAAIEYAKKALQALQINQGPTHMTVICSSLGNGNYSPCLVDVVTRCHGGQGTWMSVARECIGYTHIDATLNCYIRPDRFDELPFEPVLSQQGCEVFLACKKAGTIKAIPGLDIVRDLTSFLRVEMLTQPGASVVPTVDQYTSPGSVQLVGATIKELQEDLKIVRSLENEGMFEIV